MTWWVGIAAKVVEEDMVNQVVVEGEDELDIFKKISLALLPC
jgi:hypothetical protein